MEEAWWSYQASQTSSPGCTSGRRKQGEPTIPAFLISSHDHWRGGAEKEIQDWNGELCSSGWSLLQWFKENSVKNCDTVFQRRFMASWVQVHQSRRTLSWYFYHHTEVNISSYLAFPKAEIFFLFCQNIKLMAFNADIFRCMSRVENWSVTAEALSIILTWFYQGEIISRRAGVWVLVCEEIVNWSKTQPRLPFQGSIFHM